MKGLSFETEEYIIHNKYFPSDDWGKPCRPEIRVQQPVSKKTSSRRVGPSSRCPFHSFILNALRGGSRRSNAGELARRAARQARLAASPAAPEAGARRRSHWLSLSGAAQAASLHSSTRLLPARHYEKYPPRFCPGRSNGSLGFNAKGPPGRPGAPLVGNISGLARARGPGPMSPRCLAQIVTPACKLSTLRHRSGGGCHPALTPIWNSMWVVIG